MGHRPVDRSHLSHNTTRYRDIGGEKTEQAKSSFCKDIIFDFVLKMEVSFQYTDTHSYYCTLILNICNINQLVLIWGLTGISTRYRGQGLNCVVTPAIVTITGGALKLISYRIHSVRNNTHRPNGL